MAEKKESKKPKREPQEVEAAPVFDRRNDRRGPDEVEKTRGETFVAPDVDIYERDDSLVLVADVPGVGAGRVEVKLENGVLELTAHRGEENGPEEADYAAAPSGQRRGPDREYRPASYRRVFSLSDEIDADKITGTIGHGVLTVTLPKSARARQRKIEVKAG